MLTFLELPPCLTVTSVVCSFSFFFVRVKLLWVELCNGNTDLSPEACQQTLECSICVYNINSQQTQSTRSFPEPSLTER